MTEKKRLWIYALYAFGLAIFMGILCLVVDKIEGIPQKFRPGMGETTCFLQSMHDFI